MRLETSLEEPLVSVLMPAFNAEKYVREAIESILSQTYSKFELLVADDASSDSTRKVIESINDPRIRYFHNNKNIGKTDTVAKLFEKAAGDLLTIHDADDVSYEDRFEKQVTEFLEKPEIAMLGTNFISINDDGSEILETSSMKTSYKDVMDDIDRQSQFHGPTMMIKMVVLKELGEIYRPYFKDYNEDTDLAYRIAEKYPSYNLPDVLYKYRILPTSLCRNTFNARRKNLYKVVVFLAGERKKRGRDSLQDNAQDVVDEYMEKLMAPYRSDTSLIYREAASFYMYWKYYDRAIQESFRAVKINPFALLNIRTLVYCIRKTAVVKVRNIIGF